MHELLLKAIHCFNIIFADTATNENFLTMVNTACNEKIWQ